jgi:hypothetical protein
MPAQPLPATGAGEFVIRYFPEPHHMRAVLLRRASTGALVELGTERVSYSITQDALAGEDPSVPFSDELGYVGDVDELGALGSRIKKAAKKIAKSKLGKIALKAGKLATSFVPGGSAITGGLAAAKAIKKGVKVAKSLKRKPAPRPVFNDYGEEVGAAAPRKPAAKKPAPKAAPKPAAKKPAPKAAPKPAAKKPAPKAAPKPAAKKPAPKPKASPKPAAKKPAPKAAPKPKAKAPAKPKASAKPKAKPKPGKPAPSAKSKLQKVKAQGGAAATLAKSAAAAPTAAKAAQAAKLAALVEQIEDDAPELAATLAELPDTDPDDRDGVQVRAVAAAQKLAATPAGERAAMASTLEKRIDGWKVEAPDGTVIWVPMEEVDGGEDDGASSSADDGDEEDEE